MKRIEAPDFWQWAFSDFMSNALRGILAEYIVAVALGGTHKPRTEWDAYDLMTEDGLKIEVKSAAYLQSWQQEKNSVVRFSISPKKGWDARTNTSSTEAVRSADIYVFCVFAATDKLIASPLDLAQWFFLVCPTRLLASNFGRQKTVGLSSLEQCGLVRLSFDQLAMAIDAAKACVSVPELPKK